LKEKVNYFNNKALLISEPIEFILNNHKNIPSMDSTITQQKFWLIFLVKMD